MVPLFLGNDMAKAIFEYMDFEMREVGRRKPN